MSANWFQIAMLAYNLNCWLQLFRREENVTEETIKHSTPAMARLRFLFLAARIWRHAGRMGVSFSDHCQEKARFKSSWAVCAKSLADRMGLLPSFPHATCLMRDRKLRIAFYAPAGQPSETFQVTGTTPPINWPRTRRVINLCIIQVSRRIFAQ